MIPFSVTAKQGSFHHQRQSRTKDLVFSSKSYPKENHRFGALDAPLSPHPSR